MGQTITFAQQKGGSGKTTVLAHLAAALTQKNKSCTVFDLDPQGSLSRWVGMGHTPKITLGETASYRIASDIRQAKSDSDFVLVDCPGSAAAVLETAIGESDMVIVPCQSGMMDVWATDPILKMCSEQSVDMRVVLNRLPPRGADVHAALGALKKMGADVFKARLGNRLAFSRSMAKGRTALDVSGQAVAKAAVTAFAAEVIKRVGKG